MLQTIQQAVKVHDKYQIEIKLDYELLEGKKTAYRVSTYFFIPQSLGLNKYNYSKEDFYRDTQSYIRLKTPPLILRDFIENPKSPLCAIEQIISNQDWAVNLSEREHVVDSLKFLGAMLKSSIRDHFELINKRIDEAPPDSKMSLIIGNLVEEFLMESQKIIDKYRSLYPEFNLPNIDEHVFTSYKFVDESISLLIEESSMEMFHIVDNYITKKSERSYFQERLHERVRQETKYRKSVGYGSVLMEGDDNEEYLFRTSVLKKYTASVLYLSTATKREGTNLEHFMFAIAAGISMVFATIVAFYFQYYYGNFTFPFFIALVVGYMFKDRIKEIGRGFFSKYVENKFYDRRTVIKTQDGRHKLGVLREKVTFLDERDVPRGIIKARNRDKITELANEGQGENVIRYTKEIILNNPQAFSRTFADMNINGINDIFRYDIQAYLNKMADPVQEKLYLKEKMLTAIPAHKVYHLNLVSRYRSLVPQKEKIYKRIRLILNREGIKRIEHISL